MNNIGILDIIVVYGSAFIILLLLVATFIFRTFTPKKRNKKELISIPKTPVEKIKNYGTDPFHKSETPDRMLPSPKIDSDESKQNKMIENIEQLSPLKRGILWAEILGKPGGRRRRNT